MDNLITTPRVIGIYAKEPVPGQVKTRLTPPLSPEQAAAFYQTALVETVENMTGGDFDLVICFSGNESYFQRTFPELTLYEQQGEDLGARMSHSFQQFFRQGYRQVVLIGSDSPDLPADLVMQAFAALERQPLTVAPAHDGGYVLIGESHHHPQLFEDIPWSSPEVLSLTCQRADAAGIDYQLLSAWDDLDDLCALQRFLQRSPESRTAEYLCSLPVPECFSSSG